MMNAVAKQLALKSAVARPQIGYHLVYLQCYGISPQLFTLPPSGGRVNSFGYVVYPVQLQNQSLMCILVVVLEISTLVGQAL